VTENLFLQKSNLQSEKLYFYCAIYFDLLILSCFLNETIKTMCYDGKKYRIPVSVLMPVYNCGLYIKEAIESIINQTFRDFEFIVVDDGSTDDTLSVIKSFTDKRIVCIRNSHRGIVTALNTGLRIARGKYIARMDADDISYSSRLQKQYDFMEGHLDVTVCATHLTFEDGQIGNCGAGYWKDPLQAMTRGNVLYHATVMMRKQFLDRKKLYYRDKPYAEDYYLWFETVKNRGVLYTIPESMYYYRSRPGQITGTSTTYSEMCNTTNIVIEEIKDYLYVSQNLTVIIPFLNEGENVCKTVENIQRTTEGAVNILLINDASNDGYNYREELKMLDNGRLKYYESGERMGVAECRNAGVDRCQTPYFLFLDAHMAFLSNNWAVDLINELKKHPFDLLSLQTLGLESDFTMKNLHADSSGCKWQSYNKKNNWDIFSCEWDWPEKINDLNEVDVVLGAAYAASTESWKKLHGLSGLIHYGEDEQFMSLKYKCSGGKCYTVNYINVAHIYRENQPYPFSTFDRTYNQIIIIMTLFSGEQEQTLLRDCKRLNSNFDECMAAIDRNWIAKEKIYLESVFTPNYTDELTKVFDVITTPAEQKN
jgi:glycosyltransferase involved in cell wall biosynthesis